MVIEAPQVSPDYVDMGNPPVRAQNANVADQLEHSPTRHLARRGWKN